MVDLAGMVCFLVDFDVFVLFSLVVLFLCGFSFWACGFVILEFIEDCYGSDSGWNLLLVA